MASDSISVQVTPGMARFIRAKVESGDYSSSDALIREAITRMQTAEIPSESNVEAGLTEQQSQSIKRNVKQGLDDLDHGRYDEFDAEGLKAFADNLVAASAATAPRLKGRKKA